MTKWVCVEERKGCNGKKLKLNEDKKKMITKSLFGNEKTVQ